MNSPFASLGLCYNPLLFRSEICAGGAEGKDACYGDHGAPLVCQGGSGRWYVVGLVNWGEGCGKPGVPTVYSRISYYRDFVDSDPTHNFDYPRDDFRPAGLPIADALGRPVVYNRNGR